MKVVDKGLRDDTVSGWKALHQLLIKLPREVRACRETMATSCAAKSGRKPAKTQLGINTGSRTRASMEMSLTRTFFWWFSKI